MKKSFCPICAIAVGCALLPAAACFADVKPDIDLHLGVIEISDADAEADHDALRAMVPIYEQSVNESRLELLQPYLDPEFSGAMITGEEVDGFTSLEEYWAKMQEMMGEGGKYHVKVNVAAKSIISGDLAVSYGTTDDVVVTSRGKEYRFEGRWTAVCRKQDGRWKILRVQGTMDPVGNPFVWATVKGTAIAAGAIAGIAGLVLGWLVRVLVSRRRTTAANR